MIVLRPPRLTAAAGGAQVSVPSAAAGVSRSGPGCSATATGSSTAFPAISQPTGRQRGDGSRPSGKSNANSPVSTTSTALVHAHGHATSAVAVTYYDFRNLA